MGVERDTGPRPPAGTKPGTLHWLVVNGETPIVARWNHGGWEVLNGTRLIKPSELFNTVYRCPASPPSDTPIPDAAIEAAWSDVRGKLVELEDLTTPVIRSMLNAALPYLSPSPTNEPAQRNLAALVKRLIRRVNKYHEDDAVAESAYEYLKAHDLHGSPLRDYYTEGAAPIPETDEPGEDDGFKRGVNAAIAAVSRLALNSTPKSVIRAAYDNAVDTIGRLDAAKARKDRGTA